MSRHLINFEKNALIINDVTNQSKRMGIAHLSTRDAELHGREITLGGRK